jgi:N-methylhydantoinase B
MRGGLGQVMEIASAENAPFSVFAMFERIDHPARGRNGGQPGAAVMVSLASGKPMRGKGQQLHEGIVLRVFVKDLGPGVAPIDDVVANSSDRGACSAQHEASLTETDAAEK